MEYVKKDDVIRVIKSGCKLNSILNILVKDILEKVDALPTVDADNTTKDRTKAVHYGCETCSHSINGNHCNYYDLYKDKLILNGQCTGWKGKR